jgi:hypothetical protein
MGQGHRVVRGALVAALSVAVTAGCTGTPVSPPSSASSSSAATSPSVPLLPADCTDSVPCHIAAGSYVLGVEAVLPGLAVRLPAGWESPENNDAQLILIPADRPDDRVFIWQNVAAVKSTGPGHCLTVLTHVGRTPAALADWLIHDRDFSIMSGPDRQVIAHGLPTISLVVGVASGARYGDTGCPANPRCADLFTEPGIMVNDFYGIGGLEQVRLYLGSVRTASTRDTIVVGEDATDQADLTQLTHQTAAVLSSLVLPGGMEPT